MKPHKHAEVIKAWAEGKPVQVHISTENCGGWRDVQPLEDGAMPLFLPTHEYRIKPEAPKWPVTRMTDKEILELVSKYQPFATLHPCVARFIIDDAIARSCEDGDVVPTELHKQRLNEMYDLGHKYGSNSVKVQLGDTEMVPASMLEKVAEAVRAACINAVDMQQSNIRNLVHVAAIIASVKEKKE